MSAIQHIDVHELKRRKEANPALCLIDVRENHEWDESHIPGVIHIPKAAITERIAEISADPVTPVYLHCRGGTRSTHAGNALIDMGYREVYSIQGGISDWIHAGYEVE